MTAAITVEGLSKAYRIGLKEEVPDSLVGAVTSLARNPLAGFHRLRRLNTFSETDDEAEDVVWALKDVSFEVAEGEVVGIIGRNGAGKSTLLKVLSRITEPTHGRAVIHGRVSSLLEVGTGFHPELSGRENVYMNGTILGMTKREIDRKFDEIVDFSGVEKFLDTPIKRYSSGMQVRLAFAVAAHLEPEILIIDEVLAVGDAEFQRKCLGKMRDVSSEGRTVLFVSHNLAAVRELCTTAVTLVNGTVQRTGRPRELVDAYLSNFSGDEARPLAERESVERGGTGAARVESVDLYALDGTPSSRLAVGEGFEIRVGLQSHVDLDRIAVVIGLFNSESVRVCHFNSRDNLAGTPKVRVDERREVRCRIPTANLVPGRYRIEVALQAPPSREPLDHVHSAAAVEYEPTSESLHGIAILPAVWASTDDGATVGIRTSSIVGPS